MQLGAINFSEKHANIGTLFWATVHMLCICLLIVHMRNCTNDDQRLRSLQCFWYKTLASESERIRWPLTLLQFPFDFHNRDLIVFLWMIDTPPLMNLEHSYTLCPWVLHPQLSGNQSRGGPSMHHKTFDPQGSGPMRPMENCCTWSLTHLHLLSLWCVVICNWET